MSADQQLRELARAGGVLRRVLLHAIPAALFIRHAGYKRGILVGLSLYVVGCLLFVPASGLMAFWAFLIAYFTMTCGLAFLETTANPYILAMGPEHNAARRLNFAQAFNPIGSLLGMFVAKDLILAHLDPADDATRRSLASSDPDALLRIQQSDLEVIVTPYLVLGEWCSWCLRCLLLLGCPKGKRPVRMSVP